jgi:hypothetical protein
MRLMYEGLLLVKSRELQSQHPAARSKLGYSAVTVIIYLVRSSTQLAPIVDLYAVYISVSDSHFNTAGMIVAELTGSLNVDCRPSSFSLNFL